MFRHLVDSGFPRLSGHLESLGAGVAGVSTQWFLCLFVNSLPLETCLRVWDIFFFERCASVLFRVALALVDIYAQAPPLSCLHCIDRVILELYDSTAIQQNDFRSYASCLRL